MVHQRDGLHFGVPYLCWLAHHQSAHWYVVDGQDEFYFLVTGHFVSAVFLPTCLFVDLSDCQPVKNASRRFVVLLFWQFPSCHPVIWEVAGVSLCHVVIRGNVSLFQKHWALPVEGLAKGERKSDVGRICLMYALYVSGSCGAMK